jgi:putative addiction module component (TIGR02574 family)
MSDMLAELKKKAAQLSDVERAELALSLIESLDGPADPDVEEAWRVEIERRIGQIDRGEVARCSPDCAVDQGAETKPRRTGVGERCC